MTVAELIEKLKGLDPNLKVVVDDAEWGILYVDGVEECTVTMNEGWHEEPDPRLGYIPKFRQEKAVKLLA